MRTDRRGWLLAVFVLFACASPGGPAALRLDADSRHRLQRESLGYVFYAGSPLPPLPTPEELEAAADVLASGDPLETALLHELYTGELDLWSYAMRDTDGDGVHDFRVSDYYGKFMEGDVDLDGDGVRNVLDAAPYDRRRAELDANANGVPDPVDWALLGKSAESARRQRVLFLEHGVLLVDRSARFTDELSRSVHDVITRVLRGVPRSQLEALRVVAADETCLLAPELDDETQAMMIPQTQTLVVYRIGIDQQPFVQLGLLAHELAHGYQFSLDFQSRRPELENSRVYFPAPVFLDRVARFGWTHEPLPTDEIPEPFVLFTPHYEGGEPTYAYRGETPEWWAEWLDALYEELGDAYLEAPEVVELGILGDYSLENPWEWHSDAVIAYLFAEIEGWLERNPGASDATPLRRASREAWPSFRYANLAPEVRRDFAQALALREEDLAYFVAVYVGTLAETE